MRRCWINQPSTHQRYHHLHGCLVIAENEEKPSTMSLVYFRDGNREWQFVENIALSHGWPRHLLESPKASLLATGDKVQVLRNVGNIGPQWLDGELIAQTIRLTDGDSQEIVTINDPELIRQTPA